MPTDPPPLPPRRAESRLEWLALQAGAEPERVRDWLRTEVERRRQAASTTMRPKRRRGKLAKP